MKLHPDIYEAFAQRSGRLRTEASRRSYGEIARLFQATDPNRPAWGWKREDVLAFLGRPGFSPKTISTRSSVLMSLFGWAEYQGLIPHDPTAGIKHAIRPGHGRVRPGNWLTDQQVAEMLHLTPTTTLRERRDRMVLLIGLFTGLRASEIAASRWSSFNQDLTMLRVNGKGHKVIDMPMAEQMTEELHLWRPEVPGDVVLPTFQSTFTARFQTAKAQDRVTKMLDGSISYSGIRRVVRDAGNRIGVPTLAPHDLRRSYASWLDDTGMDIRAIRDLLRHSSVGVTERYLAGNPNRTAQALAGVRRDLTVRRDLAA